MRRLANSLLALGFTIGIVGGIGLGLGFRPSQLPSGLLDVSLYKLTFVAAGCVLAAGAMILRSQRRRAERNASSGTPKPDELSSGAPPADFESAQLKRERERERERERLP